MEQLTKEDVLRLVEEDDVEFIRLQFTDMFGIMKNIAITARELPKALNNECIIDGSFIDGMEGEAVSYTHLCGMRIRKRSKASPVPLLIWDIPSTRQAGQPGLFHRQEFR